MPLRLVPLATRRRQQAHYCRCGLPLPDPHWRCCEGCLNQSGYPLSRPLAFVLQFFAALVLTTIVCLVLG